jgi:endonuclease-3
MRRLLKIWLLLWSRLLGNEMTPQQVHDFFSSLAAANPAPKTELQYTNPYTLLVAVVLSAQSTDAGVNKATKSLFEKVQNPADMLKLGLEGLREYIKTIGLYNNKAKNIIALSQILVAKHNGQVPGNRDDLVVLPGVGRKTANVVLNVAFKQPTIAVDTHIFRVCNRTGLAPGKTPEKVEAALEKILPEEFIYNAHHWLVLHGRYICKARKPLCAICPVEKLCSYEKKNFS